MRIILATGNDHKKREIGEILREAGVSSEILTMREAGADLDIEETGTTFEENALQKARAVYDALSAKGEASDDYVLADDSGIEIDALNGEPGVYSARYLGEDTPHSEKNADLLRRLKDVPDEKRTARFVCAVACVFPDGSSETVRETMEGTIAHESKGTAGFGYDPIFIYEGFDKTNGELTPEEKNAISHRGKAFRAIAAHLSGS